MPSSCKDIREALAECLQESDCIMVERNTPKDCLRTPLLEQLPTKCQQLRKALAECKRGMIDMRKRFRGNQPIALRKETTVDPETGETVQKTKREPVPMLYAGKPAFETVKPTSGDDIASDP